MKHLTEERFEKIRMSAHEIAMEQKGCRNQRKTEDATIIKMAKNQARDCKKIPTEYKIVYTYTGNLGTNQWADTYLACGVKTIAKHHKVKETEKSIIITNGAFRDVIKKDSIVCYVW